MDRAVRPGLAGRLFANRGFWKEAIYVTAFLTYLCSFLFFGLAVFDVNQDGPSLRAIIDLMAAGYFLIQVIFLLILAWVVERRRQNQRIDFPDRRRLEQD